MGLRQPVSVALSTLPCWLGVLAGLSGCTGGMRAAGPVAVEGEDIAPYASREHCLRAGGGERLDYRFASNAPLRFTLQYRDGGALVAPIERNGAVEDGGVYVTPRDGEYCLFFEAGPAGAVISYRYAVR